MNEKNKKELMFILPKLRRYCYALTGNKDQGDDLLHNAIVKILSKFKFLKIDNFQAYMYTLISNTWKDTLRKKYREKEIPINEEKLNIVQDNNIIDDKIDFINEKNKLILKINGLSEVLRETLMLVAVEKKTYAETSEILKVPIGTIMSRLHEARRKLIEKQTSKNQAEISKSYYG